MPDQPVDLPDLNAAIDDEVERLSSELKDQVDRAKERISNRYGRLIDEVRTIKDDS